ncbi:MULTISPECIES: cobalamin B12-binding domain-containing protein [Amycolatopsis]|uniref:Cobalamin B12-binding domain-containing protein n=1 Tax=Amycolatopsis dendrobii TaxID=2760662 RepID=A0A7W3Z8I8_9PSEU|nr:MULTISPECIES: cobalamin-dependent protein [Amycolatopsis]MBB1151857.1 cobalamin B12-binding domain-containing protein [Amycolatopsis dendrobii]UKD57936.1 cobalamin-dependent protein [Amycolatopsis sp. FU40]
MNTPDKPRGAVLDGQPASVEHVAARLWDAAVDGDEDTAGEIALRALRSGMTAETVLLDVIGAVQRKVGEEWAANRLTVTQEHSVTAINDRVVAAVSRAAGPAPNPPLARVTVACVDGEWHALPARLLAEVLRSRGFRVDYLGAQVPASHLIADLHRTGPDAVALSSSIPTRLPAAHATITACQAAGVPVIAGGAAFGTDGRYARLFGADAWAPDARAAADLLAGSPPGPPRSAHQAVDDLPHLLDQEYTMISRTSAQLVKAVFAGLRERIPALDRYTELQLQHTVEDLASIVDYLKTSVYVDDPELFTGFLRWTADILAARGVPAGYLTPALDLLGDELRDFPRARATLARARAGGRP